MTAAARKERRSSARFSAVVFEGETKAHIGERVVDEEDETFVTVTTALCGTGGVAASVGGLHDRYCQSCLRMLGTREIIP